MKGCDKLLKVNEFERNTDTNKRNAITNARYFNYDAYLHYRFERVEQLFEDKQLLLKIIRHHRERQVPRLQILDEYFKGLNHGIWAAQRRIEEDKADYRVAHNFAKLITQFKVGYLTGNPILSKTKDEKVMDWLQEYKRNNAVDALHSDLMLDVSKYGRAYELIYRNVQDQDKSVLSNVFETFVIYDTTVERNPMAAIRYLRNDTSYLDDNTQEEEVYDVQVYTDTDIISYEATALNAERLIETDREAHSFGGVPIIEYQNNRSRLGDYDDILTLLDMYDNAQSDTANYLTDLNNSLLVITGDFDASDDNFKNIEKMLKANFLFLETGQDMNGGQTDLDAKYIYRQIDVQSLENYKDRLRNDIFSFSNVPDLTDENFGGNKSGEAMKYKLFGFQQAVAQTMRNFEKAMMMRYKLFFQLKQEIHEFTQEQNYQDITIIFKPNLPKAVSEELKMLTDSGTPVSLKTKLGLASFIDDVDAELMAIQEEEQSQSLNIFPELSAHVHEEQPKVE